MMSAQTRTPPIAYFDAMAQTQHRSQFGDTTFTKLFVGGLAWETPTEEMRKYFEQFGDILEAVIITDKNTGKSKGYGFVTFCDQESARWACSDPNPVIDGRRANCNIASLGRTRPSPPRGREGGGRGQLGGACYGGVPAAGPQAPPFLYPPYGSYTTYTPDYGYHHGTMYNPQQVQQAQYYQQLYGAPLSNFTNYMGSPYNYYGYSVHAAPRATTFASPQSNRPSYNLYYSGYRPPQQPPAILRQPFPSDPTDSQQRTSSKTTAGAVRSSESSNIQGKN